MSVDAGTVAEAVVVVLQTHTDESERKAAQGVLDSVKGNPQDSLDMVPALVDAGQDSRVRHFGLSIIEEALKFHWKEFSEEQQGMLKNLVLTIMAGGTRPLGEEEFYIKSKLVDCSILAMLQDWPQKWDSLLEDLVEIGSTSDTQAELVLRLLYDFSQYLIRLNKLGIVISRSHVTTMRRKQLCSSFRSAMPDLFAFLHAALVSQAEMYVEARSALEASGGDNAEALAVASSKAILVREGIRCISQFLLWINCSLLEDSPVLPVVVPFLTDPNMSQDVIVVLQKLMFRKHLRANEPYVMRIFDVVPDLFGLLSEPVLDSLEDIHASNKDIVALLAEVGMLQIRVWRRARADKRADPENMPDPELHPHFQSFIESLMGLSDAHPSLEVQNTLVKFWRRFLDSRLVDKSEGVAGSELLQEILGFANKILTQPDPWNSDDPMTAGIARLDFNNGDEAVAFKRALERRASGLISTLTRMDGHGMVNYMTQYLGHVFTTLDPEDASIEMDDEAGRTLRGLCLMSSTVVRALPRRCLLEPDPASAAAYLLAPDSDGDSDEETLSLSSLILTPQGLARSGSGNNGNNGNNGMMNGNSERQAAQQAALLEEMNRLRLGTVEALQNALEGVISYRHPSKAVIANQLRLLTSFTPYLKHYPEALPSTFEYAFSYLTYKDPAEEALPVSNLTEASIEVRGKAAKALHSIIVFVGEKMAGGLEDLWVQVQELDSSDQLRHEEKSCVYELVVISASKSGDEELQRAVVSTILEPLLANWTSDAFSAAISDPVSLLTAVGILGNDPNARGTVFSDEHLSFRSDLFFLSTVVYVVTKWSASWRSRALLPHLDVLLPALLSLISSLHGIWDSDVLDQVPEMFAPVFRIPDETPTATLARALSLPSHELEPEAQLRLFTHWLDSVQSRVYSALSSIAKIRDLYDQDGLADMLTSTVFTHLPSLPNRYLVGITMTVISSLFRMCPYAMRDRIVGPILIPWLEFMQEKLPGEWMAFYDREQNGSDLSPEQEVLIDKDLGLLTTSHARLLQTVAFRLPRHPRPEQNGPTENEASARSPDRIPHVLESEPLRSTYLQSAMMLVQTPTLTAISIAVTVTSRLLPHVSDIEDYQYVLSSQLLPALIEALAHIEEESVIRNILALVMNIYCSFTGNFPDITRGVLSAIPNVTMETLQEFEGALENAPTSRSRRELFRQLLGGVIGSNVVHKMYERGEDEKDIAIEQISSNDSGTTEGGL